MTDKKPEGLFVDAAVRKHLKWPSGVPSWRAGRVTAGGPTEVTPAFANLCATEALLPYQRRADPAQISALSRSMLFEQYSESGGLALAVLPDGRMWLVNGNHTVLAVVKANRAVTMNVSFVPVNDRHGVAQEYSIHDLHKRRTIAQSIKGTEVAERLPRLQKALSAATVILARFSAHTPTSVARDDLVAWADANYAEPIVMYDEWITGATREVIERLTRAPVMAVALEVIRHLGKDAEEFWGGAARGGLREHDPRRLMMNYLANSGTATEGRRRAIYVVSQAWNNWFANQSQDRMKFQYNTVEFGLLGTPWIKGKRESVELPPLRTVPPLRTAPPAPAPNAPTASSAAPTPQAPPNRGGTGGSAPVARTPSSPNRPREQTQMGVVLRPPPEQEPRRYR